MSGFFYCPFFRSQRNAMQAYLIWLTYGIDDLTVVFLVGHEIHSARVEH